jgi:hypothetical protein
MNLHALKQATLPLCQKPLTLYLYLLLGAYMICGATSAVSQSCSLFAFDQIDPANSQAEGVCPTSDEQYVTAYKVYYTTPKGTFLLVQGDFTVLNSCVYGYYDCTGAKDYVGGVNGSLGLHETAGYSSTQGQIEIEVFDAGFDFGAACTNGCGDYVNVVDFQTEVPSQFYYVNDCS